MLKQSTRQLIESFRYRRQWLPRNDKRFALDRKTIARHIIGPYGDRHYLGHEYCRDRELAALSFRKHIADTGQPATTMRYIPSIF